MAGGEDQAEKIVADIVVERGLDRADGIGLVGFDLVEELGVLALADLAAAKPVDGAVSGGGHEPGAGIARNPRLRPFLESHDERVLRQFLGEANVAHDARQPRDELGLLYAPDRIDGAMDVGCRHGNRYTTIAASVQAA